MLPIFIQQVCTVLKNTGASKLKYIEFISTFVFEKNLGEFF